MASHVISKEVCIAPTVADGMQEGLEVLDRRRITRRSGTRAAVETLLALAVMVEYGATFHMKRDCCSCMCLKREKKAIPFKWMNDRCCSRCILRPESSLPHVGAGGSGECASMPLCS